jgi:hypothetical protein
MSTLEKTITAALEPVVQEIVATQARVVVLERAPVPAPARDGAPGEKGDKGDRGDDGLSIKGDPGDRGEKGEPGQRGEPGERGERGEPGIKGDRGDDGLSIKGEKGDQGERGERGENGLQGPQGETGNKGDRGDDGISIEAVELGEGEFDLIFSNKEHVTIKLPSGIKGEKGEPGLFVKGDAGERGEKGERGEPGIGINVELWEPGVYREGSVVQCEFGRSYLATCDTAGEPGDNPDWVRIGKGGFRWRGLKKEGAHYEHGDLFIDNGSTFLVVDDKPRMFAQRGKDGMNGSHGKDGANGKDGASITEMAITPEGELILTRSDGDVFVADIRPMLAPLIEKLVRAHLASLNVITH